MWLIELPDQAFLLHESGVTCTWPTKGSQDFPGGVSQFLKLGCLTERLKTGWQRYYPTLT